MPAAAVEVEALRGVSSRDGMMASARHPAPGRMLLRGPGDAFGDPAEAAGDAVAVDAPPPPPPPPPADALRCSGQQDHTAMPHPLMLLRLLLVVVEVPHLHLLVLMMVLLGEVPATCWLCWCCLLMLSKALGAP